MGIQKNAACPASVPGNTRTGFCHTSLRRASDYDIFFCVHALTEKLCCIRDSYKWLQELAGTVGLAKDRTALVASPTLALDELGVYTVSWHKVALCGGRWYSLTGMFPDAKRSLRRIF